MAMNRTMSLMVQGNEIGIKRTRLADYLNLVDIARFRDNERAEEVVRDWLGDRNTIEYLGIWESLENSKFDWDVFDAFRAKVGVNGFSLSPRQWIQRTRAVGLVVQTGERAGIFAHPDIAFEFASWLSVEFKLYLMREFQRLRLEAEEEQALAWQLNRVFSKVSNRLHSQAIRANLIPESVSREQIAETYRSEADLLNLALFGMTAREWRAANPDLTGNMRDHATLEQLLVLVNLQTVNAELIRLGIPQPERLLRLNDLAIRQMGALIEVPVALKSAGGDEQPDPPMPPRVFARIVEFPVERTEPDAIAA